MSRLLHNLLRVCPLGKLPAAIKRAIELCKPTGYAVKDHFRGITKMLEIGKGGQRPGDAGNRI